MVESWNRQGGQQASKAHAPPQTCCMYEVKNAGWLCDLLVSTRDSRDAVHQCTVIGISFTPCVSIVKQIFSGMHNLCRNPRPTLSPSLPSSLSLSLSLLVCLVFPATSPSRLLRKKNSGSWCPKFVTRRGAKHRSSLFRASSNFRSGSGFGLRSVSGLSGGASSVSEDDDGREHDNGRRLSSSVPGLCEAEIRGDNWWGSHEVGRLGFPSGVHDAAIARG